MTNHLWGLPRLFPAAVLVASLWIAVPAASGADAPLLTAFRAREAYTAVGFSFGPGTRAMVFPRGVNHNAKFSMGGARITAITVAIHPTVERCRELIRDTRGSSIGLKADGCQYAFADEAYLYGPAESGGSLCFRVRNLSVNVRFSGPLAGILPALQQLVTLIQADRMIAPYGEFVVSPQIDALPVSKPLEDEAEEVRPVTRGLGSDDDLLVHMEHDGGEGVPVVISRNRWGLQAEKFRERPPVPIRVRQPDGTFVTQMIATTQPIRGRALITVYVANADNVFVWRDFEVPVKP